MFKLGTVLVRLCIMPKAEFEVRVPLGNDLDQWDISHSKEPLVQLAVGVRPVEAAHFKALTRQR